MKSLRRLWMRMRNLGTGRGADGRLREEMEQHVAFIHNHLRRSLAEGLGMTVS